MAITSAIATTWKKELLQQLHSYDNTSSPASIDTHKMALIKATPGGTYGSSSTNYSEITGESPTDEATDAASPAGYTAGGATVTFEASMPGSDSPAARTWLDFQNITWASVDLSSDGCMLYNTGASNRCVAVWDFGGTKTASGGNFELQVPAPGAAGATAVLRLA